MVTLEQACSCAMSAASGPRLVLYRTIMPNGDLLVQSHWATIACDECDTPWLAARANPST